MDAKEKAKELFDKFYDKTPNEAWFNEPVGIAQTYNARLLAKQSALICVDEMLDQLRKLRKPEYTTFIEWEQLKEKEVADTMDGYELIAWWEEVKQELQNLN